MLNLLGNFLSIICNVLEIGIYFDFFSFVSLAFSLIILPDRSTLFHSRPRISPRLIPVQNAVATPAFI